MHHDAVGRMCGTWPVLAPFFQHSVPHSDMDVIGCHHNECLQLASETGHGDQLLACPGLVVFLTWWWQSLRMP